MRGIQINSHAVEEWLEKLSDGEIALPEFQRDFVWDRHRVCKFVRAILRNQPVGCLLTLPINEDANERLRHRLIEGMHIHQKETYQILLLDGQQRLTALWRAVRDEQCDRYRYFLKFEFEEQELCNEIDVVSYPKSLQWVGDSTVCLQKNLVPLNLLWSKSDETSYQTRIQQWQLDAENSVNGRMDINLYNWITKRSEEFRTYNLPSMEMAKNSTKLEAINTFIETNTSSQKLRKFDIIVGEFFLKHHESQLRDIREEIISENDDIDSYLNNSEVGDLLLKVACLCVGLVPTEKNYENEGVLNYINQHHDGISTGIQWAIGILQADKIFDKKRLPSTIPFRVLPALHQQIEPNDLDIPQTKKIARAYMWRTFTTERYARSANLLLKEDFDALKLVFSNSEKPDNVPIWNEKKYPLPAIERLLEQTWPTRGTLSRSILAVSLRSGARDINTQTEISRKDITSRQYHHIFPKKYLEQNNVSASRINIALNCVLIGAKTNQKIGANPPLEYFKKLCVEKFGTNLNERDIESILLSHTVPESMLKIQEKESVPSIYKRFINQRAKLVKRHIEQLATGSDP